MLSGNEKARKRLRKTNEEIWGIKRHLEDEIIKIGKIGLFQVKCSGKTYHVEILFFSESSIKYKVRGKKLKFSKNALREFRKIMKLNSNKEDITPAIAATC